jgi:hypothetical protein
VPLTIVMEYKQCRNEVDGNFVGAKWDPFSLI